MLPAVTFSANKINLGDTRHNTVSNRDSFFVPSYLFQSIERSGSLTNCNPIV